MLRLSSLHSDGFVTHYRYRQQPEFSVCGCLDVTRLCIAMSLQAVGHAGVWASVTVGSSTFRRRLKKNNGDKPDSINCWYLLETRRLTCRRFLACSLREVLVHL